LAEIKILCKVNCERWGGKRKQNYSTIILRNYFIFHNVIALCEAYAHLRYTVCNSVVQICEGR